MNGFADASFWWGVVFSFVGLLVWFFKTTMNKKDDRLRGSVFSAIVNNQWQIIGAVILSFGTCILLYETQTLLPIVNRLTGANFDPGPTGWLNPGTGFLGGFFSQSIVFDRITSFFEARAGVTPPPPPPPPGGGA